MTVNCAFDLEDDDFFNDSFDNISENGLSASLAPSVSSTDASGYFQNSNSAEMLEVSTPDLNLDIEKTAIINFRFPPGFTPKAKKRKFAGPAGLFTQQVENSFDNGESHFAKEHDVTEIFVQNNITNFLFSDDDLLLPSWQSLQVNVSSSHNLRSTAKYYSIRRIFHETSKMKLPKHIVVPVLCVLLKKFNPKESLSVFIDDTGEITGRIDKEVIEMFKEHLKDGVSFILQKVTFICNVLLLTKQSLSSIFLEDGTVIHIQEIDPMPSEESPLQPMSCNCPGATLQVTRNNVLKNSCISPATSRNYCYEHKKYTNCNDLRTKVPYSNQSSSSSPKPGPSKCNSSKFSSPANQIVLNNSKSEVAVLSNKQTTIKVKYLDKPSSLSTKDCAGLATILPSNGASNCDKQNNTVCRNSVFNASDIWHSTPNESVESSYQEKFVKRFSNVETFELNDCFGGNLEMDEFDELLGSLDEKSFLEEI